MWSRHINTSPGELPAGLNTGWEEESEGGKKKDRRCQEERKWEEEALNQEQDAEISQSGKVKFTNHSLYIKILKTLSTQPLSHLIVYLTIMELAAARRMCLLFPRFVFTFITCRGF